MLRIASELSVSFEELGAIQFQAVLISDVALLNWISKHQVHGDVVTLVSLEKARRPRNVAAPYIVTR
jgi:hypothetical protein